jgi:hypothetical protein
MSDSEKKMNILIEEANANYKANRYKDAARTFEHLITLAIQNDELEEAIYFAYRAADCWRKNNDTMNRAVIFRDIGNMACNFSIQIIESHLSKLKKLDEKAKALEIAGDCLQGRDPKKAKEKYQESIGFYNQLAEKEKDADKKIQLLRDALEVTLKLDNTKAKKELMIRIANMQVSLSETELKKKTPEGMQIALRSYEDALDMFKDLKMKEDIQSLTKKITELKKKVEEYDPFAT